MSTVIAHLFQDPQRFIEHPAAPAPVDRWGQLEKLGSTFHHVDGLFYFTYAVCIFFFVLIAGVLCYSVVVWRRKTWDQPAAANITHNTPLEVVWTVVPLIIVMIMFAWGWKGSLDMTVVPADARQYKAIAKQWSWTFQYPNDQVPSFGELFLEVGKPAAFTLQSMDVLHAFFMPAMRVKRDVIPGRQQTVWFEPQEITNHCVPGTNKLADPDNGYHLFCAEYCGKDHSRMYAKVHVLSAEDYAAKPWNTFDNSTPAKTIESGANLYKALCITCHTVNGAKFVGPTWLGLWGKEEDVVEGGQHKKVKVDYDYVLESIRTPDAKKVVGYETANMSAFDAQSLDEPRVKAIVEYMKTLTQTGAGGGDHK